MTPDIRGELAVQSLRMSGRLRIRAVGTSMLPAIRPGTLLEIERIDGRDARPGEVVLTAAGDRFFVHRVRKSGDGFVITRGDRHDHDDPPVRFEQVLGRVVGGDRRAK